MLTSLLSLPAWATDLSKKPAVNEVRENAPLPLVKPPKPPRVKGASPRFVQRRLGRPSAGEGTPLVFSRTQDLALRPASGRFEFEPGQPVFSAWPDAQTAWLVRDLDDDGQITSGRELFGSFTRVGDRRAANGFGALAALDADGDGFVSPKDPAHATLQLWFDRDGDRRVGPGELERLAERALPVRYTIDVRCDAQGNCGRERSEWGDGWLIDLHLKLQSSPARN